MKRIARSIAVLIEAACAILLIGAAVFRILPNDFRGQCLFKALRGNHKEIARLLIHLGADANYKTGVGSALHCAAYQGDIPLMLFLLNHGANANLTAKFGITSLYEARRNGHIEAEHLLIKHGANPDTSHIQPP